MAERTLNGIRYTVRAAASDGWYDYGEQARDDVTLLLGRLDAQLADLRTIDNYLDWQYALHEAFESVDFHRQLIAEGRERPTLSEAREAMKRLWDTTS